MTMLTVSDLRDYLDNVAEFSGVTFYAGAINRNDAECVGLYPRGRSPLPIATGGVANTSVWVMPLSILVHWSEDTEECEQQANALYQYFLTAGRVTIGSIVIENFGLLDSGPIDLFRDEHNICEMTIRLNVMYNI